MPAGRILLKSISESKKLAKLKTDSARLLYTWLIPHVDVNGCFSGEPEVIRGQVLTRLKKTDKEVDGWLSDMDSVGLIVQYDVDGERFIFLPSFEEKQPYINKAREGRPRIPLPTPDQLRSKSGASLDKLPLKLKEKEKVKENVEIALSVVSLLNEKTGKSFKPDSAATIKLINGRIAEGRTLDDFKHVIGVKAAEWLGDPKMDRYLRPETLFAQANFESYLNERVIRKADVGSADPGPYAGFSKEAMAKVPEAEKDYEQHIKAGGEKIEKKWYVINWLKERGLV